MPHIALPEGLPGILGPMAFSPETTKPLNELAEVLLRGPNSLTPAERELIATKVSHGNECHFCHTTHGAVAAHHLGGDTDLVQAVRVDPAGAAISPKLHALLEIAGAVRVSGREVTEDLVAQAHAEGATDKEIHDTVLIAAAFCMYNRYVDGLATWAPDDSDSYTESGRRLAEEGYEAATRSLAAVDGAAPA